MTYQPAFTVASEDEGYYPWSPVLENMQIPNDSLDELVTDIFEAVNRYLESISEDTN